MTLTRNTNEVPQAVARSSPLSETHTVELGKAFQCEPKTLALIAALFPLPTLGQAFVVRFLECVAQERSSVPGLKPGDVVVCTKSIAKLGERLGFSNDTTDKYVLLFKALGMLQKQKCIGQIAFIFSLGIYQSPSSLEANLDFLINRSKGQKSRTKLNVLVTEVKQRCLVYGLISQDFTNALRQVHTLIQPQERLSRRKLDQRLLQAQYVLSTLLKQTLMGQLPPEQRRVDSFGGEVLLSSQKASNERTPQSTLTHQGHNGEPRRPTGNLPRTKDGVDAVDNQYTSSATDNDTQGRFPASLDESHLPMSVVKVDEQEDASQYSSTTTENEGGFLGVSVSVFAEQEECQQAELAGKSTQNDRVGRREEVPSSSHLPTPSGKVDSGVSLRNVDVVNIYEFIVTFTLREPQLVAKFFAERFEGDTRVYPKYQKLLSIQEGQPRTPHVLAAAFVCTMVRLHRDTWDLDRPGGFFTKKCREFDTAISPEVEEWITTYGHLSPTRLIETLTQQNKGTSQKKPVASPTFVPKPAPVPVLPAFELSVKVDASRVTLSSEEADALLHSVVHHPLMKSFRAKRIRVGKESPRYAVLIDTTMPSGPVSQTVLYHLQDWIERLEQMNTMRYRMASSLTREKGD
jgi:hypothetical protein